MAKSLQDQLLNAGLINKDKAQKLKKQKQKAKTKHGDNADEAKEQARLRREEQRERDRLLNEQRNLEAKQKALAAQIKQLVELNQLSLAGGELEYRFIYEKKVKKLYVTEAIQTDLIKGRLVVVKNGDIFNVVPRPVADKIALRDESIVIRSEQQESYEDDEYADFKIPDDLMW